MKTQFSQTRIVTVAALSAAVVVLAGFSATPDSGPEILKLEISKPAPEEIARPRTFLEFHLPMDLDGLDVGNPFDEEQSSLELMQDDQDHDLLAMHRENAKQTSVKTPSGGIRAFGRPPPTLQFAGVADETNNRNILLRISVLAKPSPAATRIALSGRAVLNFIAEGVPAELRIDDVKLKAGSHQDQRFDSEIGPVVIRSGRWLSVGSDQWREFSVHSTEKPIVGVEVIGGDDSEDVPFAISGDFALKEPPEPISLRIRYGEYDKREVPLKLDLSIGM